MAAVLHMLFNRIARYPEARLLAQALQSHPPRKGRWKALPVLRGGEAELPSPAEEPAAAQVSLGSFAAKEHEVPVHFSKLCRQDLRMPSFTTSLLR